MESFQVNKSSHLKTTLILLTFLKIESIWTHIFVNSFEKSLIGAVTFAGIFVGGFIWGMIADK
jgi:hypothetical protein